MTTNNNIFEDMTQIISLDCSSITGSNFMMSHQYEQSLKFSILNLKSVLPTFKQEFNMFRQEITQMIYFTVNKLMTIIKNKNNAISKLQDDLQKSQGLTNGMKKQVIQLKQMINEFVKSYNTEINAKEKEIQKKQKEILQIKNVLKQNFNNPSNFCKNCSNSTPSCRNQLKQLQQSCQNSIQNNQNQSFYIQNGNKKGQILIEMSQSILFSRRTDNLVPLQIIQEQGSDINSITDYLQSQRLSDNQSNSQIQNDQDSIQNKQSLQTRKDSKNDSNKNFPDQNNIFNRTDKQRFPISHQIYINNGTFSSRVIASGNIDYELGQNQSEKLKQRERERRCSQQILRSQIVYSDYHIDIKPKSNNLAINVNDHNIVQHVLQNRESLNELANRNVKIQNISKSSSSSELMHLGDTDRINLPKKFESPKNMNFVKKNTARTDQFKQQRLKTQPSPRNLQYQLNKENIHITSHSKASQLLGRKIFARKKNIKTVYMNSSSNKLEDLMQQSPEKIMNQPKNVFKANILRNQNNPNYQTTQPNSQINIMMLNSCHSNVSNINQSIVKSHHQYHSAGKNVPITPKSIKSMSKSKEKIKVTSKQNKFLVEEFNGFKKGKGSVHLGVKVHMKKNLQEIKNALKSYKINNQLKEIYYDGKYLNQLKQGYGKIIYQNGIIYEGTLKQGVKTGDSRLILNGVQIYEGNYENDKINGQGQLKSLRFLCLGQCPKILEDAKYFGRFQENKFDGMGTLYLNQKQKIVTKFKTGVPYGELTYYTQNNIQFGYWPTQ